MPLTNRFEYNTRTRLVLSLCLLFAGSRNPAFAQTDQIPFYDGDPNFLFIGNSYTATNGMFNQFTEIVRDMIPEWASTVNTQAIAPGGRTLSAHLEAARALDTVAGRKLSGFLIDDPDPWKWVVLQDQSQVPSFHEWDWEGTEFYKSREAAVTLNEYIAAAGGQTVFYLTWGRMKGRSKPEKMELL